MMPPQLQPLLIVIYLVALTGSARAFSLLGPLPADGGHAWQVPAIGYNPRNTEIGLPVNLGEEYRWNTAVLTYAFDQSFLNYFGQQGVNAIEDAINVFRELPRASDINLDSFPTENKRLNDTAASLGILDLKSTTMPLMLELLGLARPESWTWTLRARNTETIGGVTFTNYLVISRNFDPVTLQPTNRVNNAFFSYIILEPLRPGDYADAIEVPADPLSFFFTSVAGGFLFLGPGELFPGLTRDDAGGWRYLLRGRNYNVEQLPLNTTLVTNGLPSGGIGAATNIPPWTPIITGTNFLFPSNFFVGGQPWTPFVPGTNVFTNIIGTGIFVTNVIDIALRPGIERIQFRRRNFDSLLGQAFPPFTNTYTDVVISNFTRVTQKVQRVVNQPDLLFAAADLGVTGDPFPVLTRRGVNRDNNDILNGNTAQAGPGVIRPPMQILFSDILPVFFETTGPGDGFPIGPDPFDPFDPFSRFGFTRSVIWGSFDTTPAPPIIFPNNISIEELEAIIESRR